jgi:1-deoxy-D-xylulose-5-phosphate synthase
MQSPASLLPQIKSPEDVKKLSLKELNRLASEIRGEIVSTVSRNGGHLASNLGVVELSIALHRVFDSPLDKIIWDVGHQCYAHKLLTGRFEAFAGLRKAGGLAGFPKRQESPHDVFNTGHASTSISAALGMLVGEWMLGGKGRAIAVIGDGALTGGLAYEALSHAGQLGLPLIVILNDNKMSISPNVGGLSKYLSRLSMKAKYQTFRRHFDALAKRIPFIGDGFFDVVVRLKRAVKAVFYIDNFFVDLGFEYVGPIDGHHIQSLIGVLEDVRRLDQPVVIHVITRKGKGYGFAEDDPGSYHGVGSFSVSGGITGAAAVGTPLTGSGSPQNRPTFTGAFGAALLAIAERDRRVAALTAAMEQGAGLSRFKRTFPERFFDVGIAEEHAVTFAAGLAARGLKPVAAIYSTFIQRAVDQILHDTALQNLPVVFALDRAGFVPDDGETHQGLFDIALFRAAPNTVILAPAGAAELRLMLEWALDCPGVQEAGSNHLFRAGPRPFSGPVLIRYPKARCPAEVPAFSLPLETGRGVWLARGTARRICIAFTGGLYEQALEAAERLASGGIEADLYNLRFLKPIDEDYLVDILRDYELVAVAEEGIREGGVGEYAAALTHRRNSRAAVLALAVESEALAGAQGTREELLRANGLDGEGIAARIRRQYAAAGSPGLLAIGG